MFDLAITLYEYTDILLGKRKNYSDNFLENSADDGEQKAIALVRAAARAFLRCRTPEAARHTITPELLKKMKLDRVANCISVPKEVDPGDRNIYIIDKIFIKNFDEEKWIADHLCDRIEAGTLKKFPKHYLSEAEGIRRATYCLKRFIEIEFPGKRIFDLYRYATTQEFRDFLKSHLLLNTCMKLYDSPIEFLQDTIPEEYQDPDAYYYFKTIWYLDSNRKEPLELSVK